MLTKFGWENFLFKPDDYPNIHVWWKEWLYNEMNQDYFKQIGENIKVSHEGFEDDLGIFPQKSDVFKVFEFGQPKVVIIGQDPYPTINNAMGLSFSVPTGLPLPSSLQTIYKEIARYVITLRV